VAALTAMQILVIQGTGYPGAFVDWRTYEAAFDRLASGASIYAPQQLSGPYHLPDVVLIGYAYPPPSVLLFGLLHSDPFGLIAWLTLNLGLLFTALWAICTRDFGAWRTPAFAFVLAGLITFEPFISGVVAANPNIGLAGVVGWTYIGLGPRRAGIIGALSAILKVFAGAAALAVRERKVLAVGTATVVTIAVTVVTLPIVGIQSWFDFVHALTGAQPECSASNLSIACDLQPWLGAAGSVAGLTIGTIAAVALAIVRQPLLMAALLTIVIMAPANNLHQHYWIIPYVVVVAAVGTIARRIQPGAAEWNTQRSGQLTS